VTYHLYMLRDSQAESYRHGVCHPATARVTLASETALHHSKDTGEVSAGA